MAIKKRPTITYDKKNPPGESHYIVATNDGQIPKVLGRNLASGGMQIFENGATFTERTETLTVGNTTYNIDVLDIQ
jgi:hypothetical protein